MSTGLSPIFAYCGPSPEQINRYSCKQTASNCCYYQPVVFFRWCFCLLCFRLRLNLWFCLHPRLCASLLRRFFCSGGAVFGQPFCNFGVIPAVHGPRAVLRDSRYLFRLRKSLRLTAGIHCGRRTFYHPANFFNRNKRSHISLTFRLCWLCWRASPEKNSLPCFFNFDNAPLLAFRSNPVVRFDLSHFSIYNRIYL